MYLFYKGDSKIKAQLQCVKGKGKETYSSLQAKPAITATGTHIYGITRQR